MNTTSTLNRRDFIKVFSAAGTGLIIGLYLPGDRELSALTLEPVEGFVPNAWLKIDKAGMVTITVAKSEMGQGVRTSLPMIIAEELDADWTKIKVEQAPAHPDKYGSQGTGGSASIRRSWDTLRKAGATAREMLVSAAAEQWVVQKTLCKTENGVVIHPNGTKKLSYGELAEAAASVKPPENVTLKDPKTFRIIGKPVKKLDTPEKVNGTAVFGIDVKIPGMLYATIARSPVFGGKVARFDATKAKAVKGVRNVVQTDDGIVVAADSTFAAIKGRNALNITWDEGANANVSSATIHKMFEELSKQPGTPNQGNMSDAVAAIGSAATKYDAVYEAPLVAHATMEPMNATAYVHDDKCEIWAPTQSPQPAQQEAAKILGIPVQNVTLTVTLLGGGFGRRLQADYVAEAVRTSKAINAPVKVVWTREDDMQHDFYRPCTYNLLSAGLDANGLPVAWTHRAVGASSTGLVVGGAKPPYDITNIAIDTHVKDTGVPIGAWRSVGPSQNGFIVESFIDELAHLNKKDPYEYRRQLLSKNPRLKGVLELAATKAGWGTKLPAGRGRGIAAVEGFGSYVAEVAEVSVDKNGEITVHRVVCAIDCGIYVNPDTIEAQIEGAIVYGLNAAIKGEIMIDKGRVQQSNFHNYPLLRISEMPKIEVHLMQNTEAPGGIGEPGLPPIAPAVCNAIFAATGKRMRKLPIRPEDLRKA